MNTFICIDIGGTAIKYGLIQADGQILFQAETPTEADKGGPALAQKVKGLVKELLGKDPDAKGIAISTAGVVDCESGTIIHASNAIPNYIGVDYRKELAEFGLPMEIENDVNCAGLAEALKGAGKDASSVVVLTIGTGIGGCLIQDKDVYHGNCYSACEVGYFPMHGSTFQEMASTTALVANVAKAKGEPAADWNGRRIFELAEQGDDTCQKAIDDLCELLGEGMASLSFILNPERFVLGGGIMARSDVMGSKIEDSFKRHTLPLIARNTTIAYAAHMNAAGMQGALEHFKARHPELFGA